MSEDNMQPAPEGAADDRRQMFARDKDALGMGEERRFKSKRRRKVSYLTANKIDTVDYKEVNILRRFLNERGKMLPSRQSGNTAKQQRMIATGIRRAREMALLPFVVTEMTAERMGPRRDRYQPRDRDRDRDRDRERDNAPAGEPNGEPRAAEAAAPEAASAE